MTAQLSHVQDRGIGMSSRKLNYFRAVGSNLGYSNKRFMLWQTSHAQIFCMDCGTTSGKERRCELTKLERLQR